MFIDDLGKAIRWSIIRFSVSIRANSFFLFVKFRDLWILPDTCDVDS